jgi:hypothetical protein
MERVSQREVKSNRASVNEIRGRFITALRRYKLNGAEFRVIIALNDLFNPDYGMAWPDQKYLAEATGLTLRSVERAVGGLRSKGICYTKEIWTSPTKSRLEYTLHHQRIIATDPGYHEKKRERLAEKKAEATRQEWQPTRQKLSGYPTEMVGLPDRSGGLSSLGPSLGPSLGNSLVNKNDSNLEGKEKGTSEVETRGEGSLRRMRERIEARKKGEAA